MSLRALDTTFLVDLLRGRPAAVAAAKRFQASGDELVIPAPCVAELYRGSTPTSKGRTSVEALLVDYEVAVLDRAAAELAGNLVGEARRRGVTIALPDALIAGIAMRRSATLVSLDSDFARIPGLTLETY